MRFIGPAFLWALLAVGLPLWLHLTRRRKYREMPVGTLRFLREALRERRRRARFEEILLMLLRLLAVVLLALAFSRPVWLQAQHGEPGHAETIILLDASGSVTAEMAEAARAEAEKARRAAGGVVTLAQFSDLAETIDSLAKYQPRPGAPTNIQGALGWALDRLQRAGRTSGKVVLIAHLAAETLPASPPRVWPPQFDVDLVPLAPPSLDNAAVREVTLLTPYVTDEMELEVRMAIPTGAMDRTVTLEAEGVKQSIVAPPGSERVTFRFHPVHPEVSGWMSVAGDDPWPVDNRRPFLVRWSEPRRVLLVDGQPGSTPFDGQAYFIYEALKASGAAHGKSPFEPEIVYGLEGNQGMMDLSGVGAVALCGVTNLSPAAARALAGYVHHGGGLVEVLDDHWTPAATEALLEVRLFPEKIAFTGETTLRSLAEWDRTDPAFTPFDGREGGDLRDLQWRDGFDLRAGPGWRSLAAFDDGHSLLLQKQSPPDSGEGTVVICAHPLTRAWGDLPLEPLFVPLIKNLFATVARLPKPLPEVRQLTPGLVEKRAPGLYLRPDGATEVVAADSAESLVRSVEPPVFRTAFGLPEPGAAHEAVAAQASVVVTQTPAQAQAGEWWPWIVLGLCLVLAVESLVAARPRPLISTPV